jgi:RsiW-degrading membrane proteinase PrsW (M82 family)
MTSTWRRWAWVGVLVVGTALWLIVLRTMLITRNPAYVPAMILLGATVVPASFMTFAEGRSGQWEVPGGVLATSALFGGVVGVVVAGRLEYATLRGLGVLPIVSVAIIEEGAKLLVPVAILMFFWRRRREPADGLVIGVASGMGFAALETMGYAFTALIASGGSVGAAVQTLFVRGLFSPAGHTAWTGLTAGALWAWAARPSGKRLLILIATFVGAVALHAAWDTFASLTGYLIIAAISVGWLLLEMHRLRCLPASDEEQFRARRANLPAPSG